MSASRAGSAALAWAICGIACTRQPLDASPPPDASLPGDAPPPSDPCDRDGDGRLAVACGGDDCDDRNPNVQPAAPDLNAVPGAWATVRVLTRVGGPTGGTAVAVDRRGGVHVVYGDSRSGGMVYARRTGPAWQIESVDALGSVVGETPAISLDARGSVHVVYAGPEGIRHGARTGGSWAVEAVDSAGRGTPALAVDPGGAVHVAYVADDGLRHATNRDGAWAIDLVDALGGSPSLAVDQTGTLHLSYAGTVRDQEVARYAAGTAGAWRVETTSQTRSGPSSIVLDRTGHPRIAFAPRYITDRGVVYLARGAGGWSDSRVPTTDSVYSASLRLDAQDEPRILFSYLGDIVHAVRTADAWTTERLVIVGHHDVRPSFDLDAAGTAHVTSTTFFYPNDTSVEYSTNRQLAPDGVDQNCDGVDGVDADGDGHASRWTGGDDCDDDDSGSPADCQ